MWTRFKTKKKLLAFLLGTYLVYYIHINYNKVVEIYLINSNTEGKCVLPEYDAFDKSISKLYYQPKPIKCENWLSIAFVDNEGYLRINQTAVSYSGFTHISCNYSIIKRKSDYKVEEGISVPFEKPIYMESDFFIVKCVDGKNKQIYKQLHHTIDSRNHLTNYEIKEGSENNLNIYMFGIDSLSRLAGERLLPRTLRYFKDDLEGYIMKGYTKVHENTFPNMVTFLTGKKCYSEELPPHTEILDPYPFIWKNFSKSGYVTMYAEDLPNMGSLTYWKGFKKQPCMHDMRPFYLAMDKVRLWKYSDDYSLLKLEQMNIHWTKSSALCLGNHPKHLSLINYYKQFIQRYATKRKFALSWMGELSHEFNSLLKLADNDILMFFKWMREKGHLKNSILILLSDHGAPQINFKNTLVGRVESRMPLFAIAIPKHIKTKYPNIHRNLERNTKRLLSPYDTYSTLVDVLNGTYINEKSQEKHDPRGISMFKLVSENRSCEMAGIPAHYCTCNSYERVQKENNKSIYISNFVVAHLNKIVQIYLGKCRTLKLHKTRDIYFIKSNFQRQMAQEEFTLRNLFFSSNLEDYKQYYVVIETVPGNALFDATVRLLDNKNIEIVGSVSRLNKYGNQSACITDKISKPFCYCGN